MAFRDFVFPTVQFALGLSLAEADLFSSVAPLEISEEFEGRIDAGVDLAPLNNTEKARSEFIIAPILLELRQRLKGQFGLFSGIEFDVDSARGLNGNCDFILTRSTIQSVMTAPIVTIAEAKKDNIRNGLGQCIAAMVAARDFNAKAIPRNENIHGVVTTGSAWKFLRLSGSELTLDRPEYFIAEPGRIMGIFAHILRPISC